MNHLWSLPQESLAFPGELRTQTDVLLSYEGPALVKLTDGRYQFLGLAVDEDESSVRWLQAPISDLELEALRMGAEPLRRAFEKERLTVVDYSRDRARRVLRTWDVSIDNVPEEALPELDAFLPGSRRRKRELAPEAPSFRLEGQTSKDRVTFGELSAITARLQSLWDAFAQSLNIAAEPLAVKAFGTGSLRVYVHTEPSAFERIATHYRQLLLDSQTPTRLSSALTSLPPRVASTYRDYLEALTNHRVEVLTEWRGEAAFVSYATATRVRSRYPAASALRQQAIDITGRDVRWLRGIFQGFLRTRGFEFYDLDGNKRYQGAIDPSLRDRMPPEFDMPLGRGFSKRYRAQIEISRPHRREIHRLLNFEEIQESTSLPKVSDSSA